MISIKLFKQGEDLVIGACDEHLLGQKFVDGKFQINVTRNFYDGERIQNSSLKRFLEEATIANLVGEETVKLAIKYGFVDPECVLKINGIPHAQIVRMI